MAMSLPDRVQAAADRLRHLAAAATPGTWTTAPVTYGTVTPAAWEIHAQDGQNISEDVISHQLFDGGGIHHGPDADYITALQPKVGALLAVVLTNIASRMRKFEAAGWPPTTFVDPDVVALVDAVLTATGG